MKIIILQAACHIWLKSHANQNDMRQKHENHYIIELQILITYRICNWQQICLFDRLSSEMLEPL